MDKTWLDNCITAGEFLYGEYPISVLQELYSTKGEKISTGELQEFFDSGSMMVCDGEMVSPLIATEREMLRLFKEADKNGNPYSVRTSSGTRMWCGSRTTVSATVSSGTL